MVTTEGEAAEINSGRNDESSEITFDFDDEPSESVLEDIRERVTPTSRDEAHRAETVAARIMQQIGFPDAEQTQMASDQGRDIIASGAIAEVKWRAAPAGRPDAQKLGGALLRQQRLLRRNDKMFFFSKSGFSPHAVAYADDVNMALFEFRLDGTAKAVNKHAKPYAARYPAVITGSVPARKTQQRSRRARLIQDVAECVAVFFVLLLIPLAALVGAGYLAYVGTTRCTSGSIGLGIGLMVMAIALVAFIVLAFRWLIQESEVNPTKEP